jgi:methyltransferase (TIGR00027 family)
VSVCRVPGDLGGRWPERLLAAAFDRAQPAAWLAEGLLIYLSEEQATRLLTSVGELSASGSRLAMEHERLGNAEMRRRARSLPAMREYEELWKGGVTNTPAWLAAHGWQTHLHERMQVAAALGRPLSEPSSGGFLTAERE